MFTYNSNYTQFHLQCIYHCIVVQIYQLILIQFHLLY
jgi:hypothetical protein